MYKTYAIQWMTRDIAFSGEDLVDRGGKLFASRMEAVSYYREMVKECISGGYDEAKVTLKGMTSSGEIVVLAEIYDKMGLPVEVEA